LDVAHQERAVEGDAALRKPGLVREVAREDFLDLEGLDLPAPGLQRHAVEPARLRGRGVAQAPGLEEGGRLGEARKAGRGRKVRGWRPANSDRDLAVGRLHLQ